MATTGITIQLNAVDQTAAAVEAARGRFVAMQQSISARSATISESGKKALSGWEEFGARIIGIRYAFQSISAIAMRATEPFRRLPIPEWAALRRIRHGAATQAQKEAMWRSYERRRCIKLGLPISEWAALRRIRYGAGHGGTVA